MQVFHFRNIPKHLKKEKNGFSDGVWLATTRTESLPIFEDLEQIQSGSRLLIKLSEEDTKLFLNLAKRYNNSKSLTARVILDLLSQQKFHSGRH